MRYTSFDIIFNPNSTGPSKSMARTLRTQLAKTYPKLPIHLHATKRAGHATELAYKAAKSSQRPLIISSSGDGGYNEVINGAVKAQLEGTTPTCAVLAAGNANDHSRTLHDTSLFELIKSDQQHRTDLLKLTITSAGQQTIRYAHSYIGLGLTPVVAVELNKHDLNALNELWIALKTFYKFRPFKIKHQNKIMTLDSIIFANIGEMAKVLTISKRSKPNDGKFEVVMFRHKQKIRLIRSLAKAMVTALDDARSYKKYAFVVLKIMPAQLDGEVVYIQKDSEVLIEIQPGMLHTVVDKNNL